MTPTRRTGRNQPTSTFADQRAMTMAPIAIAFPDLGDRTASRVTM